MPISGFAPPIADAFGPIAIRSKPRAEMQGLLALLKVRTIHAVLVTLLVVAQYWLQLASSLWQQPRLLAELFFGMFAWNVGYYIVGFAIIAVVEARLAPGRARTITLICAILVWVLLWNLWSLLANSHFIVVELGLVSSEGVIVSGLWANITYFLLAVWYYESIDRATRSTAALRESELARRGAERWLLELRLGALQARLDPQVLFDTLDEAGRLYRSRPAGAEQLLDALIDYLRLALPQLRHAESTLAREVALAVAYARVLRTPDGEPLELESDVVAAVGDARFPPMVVQPLCDALARSALASGAPARMHISASRESDRARLCVTAQAVRTAPESTRLAEVRHTLESMFAPLVRMEATSSATGVARVLMEVPYVAAPRLDR
jgi:hypothetical protein